MKTGLLINNIGTPEASTRDAVKTYLDEFLMDPDVIPLPYPLRFLLVRGLITPRRSGRSAEKYAQIWTDEGSPLMVLTRRFADALAEELGSAWSVKIGMRYGQPSIRRALEDFRAEGVDRIICAPMYPQEARATTGGAVGEFRRQLENMKWNVPAVVLAAFHAEDEFLRVQCERVRPFVESHDHVVFSFHGLPENQVGVYRDQALRTARDLADRLGLEGTAYSVGFQSRLGPAKWIGPSTDEVLKKLAETGVRRVAVACPSFVTDCLETLEEIGIGARADFKSWGGEELTLVPALNGGADWARAFSALVGRLHPRAAPAG